MKRLTIAILMTLMMTTLGWSQAVLTPGFDVFRLGMTVEKLKTALKSNSYFLYSGDPDVTLLERPNTHLIDVPGISFFTRGVFQIVDGKLYSITMELNPDQLDYFTMYTALTKKYGDPVALDPSSARWENASVRLSLEKPLTVKYLDMPAFEKIQSQGRAQRSMQALTREKFLQAF